MRNGRLPAWDSWPLWIHWAVSLVIVTGLVWLTLVATSAFETRQIWAPDPPCVSPDFGPPGGCLRPARYSLGPDVR
jgi:hypothetical protein